MFSMKFSVIFFSHFSQLCEPFSIYFMTVKLTSLFLYLLSVCCFVYDLVQKLLKKVIVRQVRPNI